MSDCCQCSERLNRMAMLDSATAMESETRLDLRTPQSEGLPVVRESHGGRGDLRIPVHEIDEFPFPRRAIYLGQ